MYHQKRPSPAAAIFPGRTTTRERIDRKQTRRSPEQFQHDEEQVGPTADRRAQSTADQLLRPLENVVGFAPTPNLPYDQKPTVRSTFLPSLRPVASAQPKEATVATYLSAPISMDHPNWKMPRSATVLAPFVPKEHPPVKTDIGDAARTSDRVTLAKGYDELDWEKLRRLVAPRRPVTLASTYEPLDKKRQTNRPLRPAASAHSTIRGKAKPATLRPEAMVLTPKTLPSQRSSAPVLPTSSQLTAPVLPKDELASQRQFSDKKDGWLATHRNAAIATVAVTVLIIVVSIGIAVYVTTNKEPHPSLYDGPAMTFSESHCSLLQVAVPWKKCVVGSPPSTESCAVAGRCNIFLYGLTEDLLRRVELTDGSTTYQYTKVQQSRYPLLCQLRTGSDITTGVCSKGRCDSVYLGPRDGSWFSESTWEDNCDEVNACWNDTAMMRRRFLRPNHLTREQCRFFATKQLCKVGVEAVVWMQHLRCNVGRNRTTYKPCQGLPLRLWRCGDKCPKPSYHALCNDSRINDDCEYTCESRSLLKVLPDGAKCVYNGNHSKEAYCYEGRCFPAEVYDRQDRRIANKISDRAECLRRREIDEA